MTPDATDGAAASRATLPVNRIRPAYEQIAGLSDIPKEVARQSDVLVSKLYMRAGKFPEAEKKLATLAATLSPGDSDKPFIEAYLAESPLTCVALGSGYSLEEFEALERASARG